MAELKNILNNFNNMLLDRGLENDKYKELLKLDSEELETKIDKNYVGMEHPFNTKIGDDMFIYWSNTSGNNFKQEEINKILKKYKGKSHYIIISLYDKSPTWSNLVEIYHKYNIKIEFFSYTDFMIDIRGSVFIPDHIQLMQFPEFLKDCPNLNETDIPHIPHNDYLVRYIGGKPGQFLKITQTSIIPLLMCPIDVKYKFISSAIEQKMIKNTGYRYDDYL